MPSVSPRRPFHVKPARRPGKGAPRRSASTRRPREDWKTSTLTGRETARRKAKASPRPFGLAEADRKPATAAQAVAELPPPRPGSCPSAPSPPPPPPPPPAAALAPDGKRSVAAGPTLPASSTARTLTNETPAGSSTVCVVPGGWGAGGASARVARADDAGP